MPSITISTRLDPDEVSLLESLAELSGFDRSTLVKSLLRKGMGELRLEQATDAYRSQKITLSRAAEIAGVHPWDFVARMKDQSLELHYSVEDFETDLKTLAEKKS